MQFAFYVHFGRDLRPSGIFCAVRVAHLIWRNWCPNYMGSLIAARIFDLWRMGHVTWSQDPFGIILHGMLSPGDTGFFFSRLPGIKMAFNC